MAGWGHGNLATWPPDLQASCRIHTPAYPAWQWAQACLTGAPIAHQVGHLEQSWASGLPEAARPRPAGGPGCRPTSWTPAAPLRAPDWAEASRLLRPLPAAHPGHSTSCCSERRGFALTHTAASSMSNGDICRTRVWLGAAVTQGARLLSCGGGRTRAERTVAGASGQARVHCHCPRSQRPGTCTLPLLREPTLLGLRRPWQEEHHCAVKREPAQPHSPDATPSSLPAAGHSRELRKGPWTAMPKASSQGRPGLGTQRGSPLPQSSLLSRARIPARLDSHPVPSSSQTWTSPLPGLGGNRLTPRSQQSHSPREKQGSAPPALAAVLPPSPQGQQGPQEPHGAPAPGTARQPQRKRAERGM